MTTPDGGFVYEEDSVLTDPAGNTSTDDGGEPLEAEDVTSGHGPRNRFQHMDDAATVNPYGTPPDTSSIDPVLVRVVESPPPRTMRRRFITGNIPLRVDDGTGLGARRVLPQNFHRTKAILYLKPLSGQVTADRVWVSQDESPGMSTGWALDDREGFPAAGFPISTTEDVWVALDPAATTGALLLVYAEYVTELHEHAPGDKRHAGTQHRE